MRIILKYPTAVVSLIAALSAFSASAQLQTLVTGTDVSNSNSPVITVSSNSYVVFDSARSEGDFTVAVTVQDVSFNFDPSANLINGYTFAGPATIQLQGNNFNPTFATIDVALLRRAVGTNIQTLVVSPTNQNSATITVSSNSYAVINSAATESSANLAITVQGASLTYALQDVSVNGLTFAGPGTIQLQGDSSGPSFATVETMPMRKSFRTQVETVVVTPSNTNSATINVSTNSSATITSLDRNLNGTLLITAQGVTLSFPVEERNVIGNTVAGPATIQLQGDGFSTSFITVTTSRK